MKNSWKIYSKDMNNIVKNWVAAMIIGGLIILPSLYAWLNIYMSWDPYGNTDQIPIGVVNEDTGAEVQDETIDVGDELVDTLKDNDKMDWQFTDREKAMDKLEHSDYFAVILIPENFSEKLSTVMDDKPEKGNIEYYVNEKSNAIAPKITDKGASSIIDQMTGRFISTVNGVIFDMFDEIGLELHDQLPDIETFEDYIFKMEEDLPEIHDLVSNGYDDTKEAQSLINQAEGKIPQAEKTTENGLQTVHETSSLLSKAQNQLDDMAPKIKKDLQKAENTAGDINDVVKNAQNQDIDFSKGRELQEDVDNLLDNATNRLDNVEQSLKDLRDMDIPEPDTDPSQEESAEEDSSGNDKENTDFEKRRDQLIDDGLARVDTLRGALKEAQQNGENITSFVKDKRKEVDKILSNIADVSGNAENRIGDFLREYKETIEPEVKEKIGQAQGTLGNADNILTDIQSTIPEVKNVLNKTENHIDEGQDYLTTILNKYPVIHDKVNKVADNIRDVQDDTDINQIIDLLRNDSEAEKNFFEEPIKLNENEVFPVQNFGAGMTPFYTVLAFWVGGLLLISLLATDVNDRENLTGREQYFGKLFSFMTFGLLQSLIVTLGDLYILGVEMAHPVWFVLFGLFISMVFVTIVYTLVSLFGDVGKAMVIVLLVLQLSGAGGTYPMALVPEFFHVIHPYLPFTYAIDLMREAVGGIIWQTVFTDAAVLAAIGIGVLILGTLFKNVLNKHTDRLMKKSREAGLFH
ncbi:YhgE/Pip domain-containing protein [Barrientosiimonas marina]|uniref:YhgE/Pip family protein n=1 Tax=Lentibacillus kimchii TaxID=1542911 RepID=A0ABW2URD2_9BACI